MTDTGQSALVQIAALSYTLWQAERLGREGTARNQLLAVQVDGMTHNTVVTIGREYGSGGRVIGQELAKKLDIPFYDNELIDRAAEKSGLSTELLKDVDEQPVNVFLQTCSTMVYTGGGRISLPTEVSLNDRLFFAQSEVIRELASKGPCVIVGRCADYVLRDDANTLNIFIHAPLSYRIERAVNVYGIARNRAKNFVAKMDKKRSSYYNYYTNKQWNDARSYDLCIDSTVLGEDGTAALIGTFVQMGRIS